MEIRLLTFSMNEGIVCPSLYLDLNLEKCGVMIRLHVERRSKFLWTFSVFTVSYTIFDFGTLSPPMVPVLALRGIILEKGIPTLFSAIKIRCRNYTNLLAFCIDCFCGRCH